MAAVTSHHVTSYISFNFNLHSPYPRHSASIVAVTWPICGCCHITSCPICSFQSLMAGGGIDWVFIDGVLLLIISYSPLLFMLCYFTFILPLFTFVFTFTFDVEAVMPPVARFGWGVLVRLTSRY